MPNPQLDDAIAVLIRRMLAAAEIPADAIVAAVVRDLAPTHAETDVRPVAEAILPSLLDERQREIKRLRMRVGLKRLPFILCAIGTLLALTYWALVSLQPLARPATPTGGWVITPPRFVALFIAMYAPAFILPILTRGNRDRWRADEAALGLPPPPRFSERPLRYKIGTGLFLTVLAALLVMAVALFFRSFNTVSPAGIRVYRFTRYVDYTYDRIRDVTLLPPGYRLHNSNTGGPQATITFDDGSFMRFGEENTLSPADIAAITRLVSERSSRPVRLPSGAHAK